jgi:hypothetical protein
MNSPDRRQFIGALGAPLLLGAAQSGLRAQSSEKVKVGIIGCGWWGGTDANAALKAGASVVALADADSDHLKTFAADMEKKQGSLPKTYKDYRELLDQPGLEAVIIATPPHWHALPFIAACRKGLHIYQEKPLAYDIREGRAMVEAAKKNQGIVQIGFQRRQSPAYQQAAQFIKEGKAGANRAGGRADPLPRRYARPHSPGSAGVARLGAVVRPRAEIAVQPGHRAQSVAPGGALRQRPPGGLGHPFDGCDARDSGGVHAEVG